MRRGLFASPAWREAKRLVHTVRVRLAIGALLVAVNRASGFVFPVSIKFLVDGVVGGGDAPLLGVLVAASFGAMMAQSVSSLVSGYLFEATATRVIADVRRTLQRRLIHLPVRFFDARRTGVLTANVMSDVESVRFLVAGDLVNLVMTVVTGAIAVVVICYLNWRLTLALVVVTLAIGVGLAFLSRRLRRLANERKDRAAELSARLVESIGGVRTVKAYAAERREIRAFEGATDRLVRKSLQMTWEGTLAATATTLIFGGLWTVLLLVAGQSILRGEMTLGDLFMYLFLAGYAAAPVWSVLAAVPQASELLASLDRIADLQAADEAEELDAGEGLGDLAGEIVFEGVSFEYAPGVRALEDVSFRAPAGTTTALVGPSGSGKSTLVGLILAFYRPTSGRVLVDRRDLASARLRDYRRQLGVVLQDNFLFAGTIAENIAYARSDATPDDVREAGRLAHCREFVRALERGYETRIGERGVTLSGGQRQRIAIARAILANPRILILDEATSSLDSESEALINDGIRTLSAGRTTFVIAHRLSTVRDADQILVLDGGRIVERGTHDELLALGGLYRRLCERQFAGTDARAAPSPPADVAE
jgi:ABC-type multidrug transport system fused ATPase/permease subunit